MRFKDKEMICYPFEAIEIAKAMGESGFSLLSASPNEDGTISFLFFKPTYKTPDAEQEARAMAFMLEAMEKCGSE